MTIPNDPTEGSHDAVSTPPGPEDPRHGFAAVTAAIGQLIDAIEVLDAGALSGPTPCPEFTVADLLDHVVMVMRRVAAIGNGDHFSTVQHRSLGAGWAAAYRSSAHDVMEAWTDPDKLDQLFQVPWGEFSGGPILATYTGELAVHGWDLATATGRAFTVDDEILGGPLLAAKFIPAEGRDQPEVPFGPVVDPGPDAPVLDQLAGWMGRQVVSG